jgi:hypothetical protein
VHCFTHCLLQGLALKRNKDVALVCDQLVKGPLEHPFEGIDKCVLLPEWLAFLRRGALRSRPRAGQLCAKRLILKRRQNMRWTRFLSFAEFIGGRFIFLCAGKEFRSTMRRISRRDFLLI